MTARALLRRLERIEATQRPARPPYKIPMIVLEPGEDRDAACLRQLGRIPEERPDGGVSLIALVPIDPPAR
jgi:hypothetical protein